MEGFNTFYAQSPTQLCVATYLSCLHTIHSLKIVVLFITSCWEKSSGCIFFLKFTYLFLREREHMSWRGAEREGYTESEAGSRQSVQSPTQGSNPGTAKSWPEPKSDAQPTEPSRHPSKYIFNIFQLKEYAKSSGPDT